MANLKKYAAVSALIAMCFMQSCRRNGYAGCGGLIWNTVYHATYAGSVDMNDSIIATLEMVGKSVSAFDSTSTVSKINRNDNLSADPIFLQVYNKSVEVWEKSGRYFDPTLAPLINAYGFGYSGESVVNESVIDSLRRFVGLEKTSVEGGKVLKQDSRTEFNFSAIAKGFGADMAGEMFRRNGIADYMIEIGGEIALAGRNPHGGKWRVSVDSPVMSRDSIVHVSQIVLELTDCGVATSGNYRNYRKVDGKNIGHTIDPRTGLPAANDLLSATVIAPTCMEADAFATACMAMGSVKARQMIEREGLAAFLILADGSTWRSTAFSAVEK